MYYSSDLLCLQQLHCTVLLTGLEITVTGQCKLQNGSKDVKTGQKMSNGSKDVKRVKRCQNGSKEVRHVKLRVNEREDERCFR